TGSADIERFHIPTRNDHRIGSWCGAGRTGSSESIGNPRSTGLQMATTSAGEILYRTVVLHAILIAGIIATLFISACESSARVSADGNVQLPEVPVSFAGRDSAGVDLIDYSVDDWRHTPEWTLDAEPITSIGVVEGPREYQFANITAAVRLDDQTLVVADGNSGELRYYDALGGHVRSVGGRGDGPGEYRAVSILRR